IYLIDHAWTYTWETARRTLENSIDLVERMCSIMNVCFLNRPVEDAVNDVLREMWKFNNSYLVQNSSQSSSLRCWFIMDEFGSRVQRAEDPTFSIVPFFYASQNIMFCLMFPKCHIDAEVEATYGYPRFNSTLPDDLQKVLKYPWDPQDLSHIDFNLQEPDADYFASGRHQEIIPCSDKVVPPSNKTVYKVYSEYPDVKKHLTHPLFKMTDEKLEADILWLSERIYDYKELLNSHTDAFFVNQFPSEQVLINKDLLAVVCRRCCQNLPSNIDSLEANPIWLPVTYNLLSELPQFSSHFLHREKRNMKNIWICKPFNLARGMEIYITDDLSQIIRLSETRPLVACEYITDPVLFPVEEIGIVKMDLRFIVLLRKVRPLDLYVYQRFWIRFANKPFSLDDFEDYEKHFTVMNYNNFPLKQMYCHDFIKKFEDYYSSYKWCDIEESIYEMINEIFTASTLKEPPAGIGDFSASRAMYGLDIMLKWDRSYDVPKMIPVILEVNFMPDCKRACDYYPEFYDDIFSVLFLDDVYKKHVKKI
ncbi:tubulin--tyrosine ligase-like protein 12, partial [Uloborus diversus]|uniref:tubulin--tyrosine ligase-like protein 12 n=1 Tax=Uloborus diversus TaxID=327109 RepID=UPI00240A3BA0